MVDPCRRPNPSPRSFGPAPPSLGATYDGAGTNFSVFSEVAEKVELCLIDDNDRETRINLDEVDGYVARLPSDRRARPALRLPGARPVESRRGTALRPQQAATRSPTASRSTATSTSARRCFLRPQRQGQGHRGNRRGWTAGHDDQRRDQPVLQLGSDHAPRTPYHETIIYEAHVKGMTETPSRGARTTTGHLRRPGSPLATIDHPSR